MAKKKTEKKPEEGPSRELQMQAALDAVVVELRKMTKRAEEAEESARQSEAANQAALARENAAVKTCAELARAKEQTSLREEVMERQLVELQNELRATKEALALSSSLQDKLVSRKVDREHQLEQRIHQLEEFVRTAVNSGLNYEAAAYVLKVGL